MCRHGCSTKTEEAWSIISDYLSEPNELPNERSTYHDHHHLQTPSTLYPLSVLQFGCSILGLHPVATYQLPPSTHAVPHAVGWCSDGAEDFNPFIIRSSLTLTISEHHQFVGQPRSLLTTKIPAADHQCSPPAMALVQAQATSPALNTLLAGCMYVCLL
jgi:hypothetical protein